MSTPARRPREPDPIRDQVVEVRRGLFRLHKILIDRERGTFEAEEGPQSNTGFLQALIDDPRLSWLQPFTRAIVEIDETLASREPLTRDQLRELVVRARSLVLAEGDEGGEEAARRYLEARERHPEALLAHLELTQRIRTALEMLDGEAPGASD